MLTEQEILDTFKALDLDTEEKRSKYRYNCDLICVSCGNVVPEKKDADHASVE